LFLIFFSEKNELSFIETSALDSTNVEAAFQNILTGKLMYTKRILAFLLALVQNSACTLL